ncbi:pyrroloquinoline quinone precursor peptide PqqA [Streptomyces sp. NBC_00316]
MLNSAKTEQQTESTQPACDSTWQSPDFTVVDTAMEVTAYSLSTL